MKKSTIALGAALALLVAGCGSKAEPGGSASQSAAEGAHTIVSTIPAPSLANNLLGDPAERDIIVYLPTSYYTSDERYPVVYFLAGYQEHVGMLNAPSDSMWAQMQMDGTKEFIIVEADGINTLAGVGGNFYTNSPVTGNAEDFVTKDLVSYIDGTYRTVAKASARGLSGFSMGGSGTINVGLKHPNLYAALYANSPASSLSRADSRTSWRRAEAGPRTPLPTSPT